MNELVSDFFVGNFMHENEVCYDPFMGTGTTAISCKRFGVNWIGSEISKEYCEMAIKRIKENYSLMEANI